MKAFCAASDIHRDEKRACLARREWGRALVSSRRKRSRLQVRLKRMKLMQMAGGLVLPDSSINTRALSFAQAVGSRWRKFARGDHHVVTTPWRPYQQPCSLDIEGSEVNLRRYKPRLHDLLGEMHIPDGLSTSSDGASSTDQHRRRTSMAARLARIEPVISSAGLYRGTIFTAFPQRSANIRAADPRAGIAQAPSLGGDLPKHGGDHFRSASPKNGRGY